MLPARHDDDDDDVCVKVCREKVSMCLSVFASVLLCVYVCVKLSSVCVYMRVCLYVYVRCGCVCVILSRVCVLVYICMCI